jgi:hypothetical protein
MIEDVGTATIQILKDFANAPKVIAIVGKNNRSLLKEFTGESISAINRVIVDVGNPLSRTIAGRVQMAEQMLQMQLIKTPAEYFQVMETGKIEVAFEGDMAEMLLIKAENEKMLDGKNPLVSPMDQHSIHIKEHRAVLADPELREDANLVKVALDHIEDHMNALRNTDPALLQMVGETAIPPVGAPPAGPQGAPQGNPDLPNPPLENSPMQSMMAPNPEQTKGAPMINGPGVQGENLPNLPKPAGEFKGLPTDPAMMAPR